VTTGYLKVGMEHVSSAALSCKHLCISADELTKGYEFPPELDIGGVLLYSGSNALVTGAMGPDDSFDEVRRRDLASFDGWEEMLHQYRDVLDRYPERAAAIEVDLGDFSSRARSREALSRRGVTPIWRPFDDTEQQFDELASEHGAVAVAPMVGLHRAMRAAILGWVQRKSREVKVRVHLMGAHPSDLLVAFPPDSYDTTSWMSSVKWDGHTPRVCMKRFSRLDRSFHYAVGDGRQWSTGVAMGAFGASLQARFLGGVKERFK